MEAQKPLLLQTLIISLLLLLLLQEGHSIRLNGPGTPKYDARFINVLCRGTTHAHLCSDTLLPYASAVGSNRWKLCNRAMWVTLQAARNSTVLLYGLSRRRGGLSRSESEVVGVCMENVADGADMLRQSMRAMGVGELRRSNFDWQMSNVITWMSSVITDMSTCNDTLGEVELNPDLKRDVAASVDKVEKLASNALSLINGLHW